MRGRKPLPTSLRLVTGNAGKRRLPKGEPKPEGKPVKPAFVKGKAAKLWEKYFRIGFWLTEADSHALALWCALGAEMEKDLARMTASRISQWRALSSELGFLPASRSRLSVEEKRPPDPSDQFYS